ncbi:phage portal protein [Streptomyces sp. IMTB 2501]|uniref:phage portal protein n=1 Tax=Streptomyces sp. IMTB 2501 TaxID=1776340 RepID=UPI00211672CB|nr:phage portal protein [Streptomyces sp. IMTB 2501]
MATAALDTPGNEGVMSPPSTPQMWMDYLASKLASRSGNYKRFGEYYDGKHQKMLFAQSKYRTEFAHIFERWNDNFCGLIIDSVNERMFIDGFRLSEEPTEDTIAREIWQRNRLDSESNAAHLDAMIQGAAYAVVWADDEGKAVISIESAEHMVVQYKPGSRHEIEAASKYYVDDWGRQFCTLWWGDKVYTGDWKIGGYSIDRTEPNPLGRPPVVPIQNRARLVGEPMSDLATVIPIQDAINKTVADSLVASEYAAWPQRYVTGLEIQEDENGNPIEPFKVAVDKLLQAEDPAASFGQFAAADLSNYVDLVDMLVQHMASISRIPFHYMLKGGQPPSGDAITSAEAGLVSKTKERMLHFGEAWEEVIRLAVEVEKGGKQEEYAAAEVIWRDPENRTEAQHIDSLLKLQQLNVPKQQLWQDAGYTPSQIARFDQLLEEEARTEMERADKYQTQEQKQQMAIAQQGADDKSAMSEAKLKKEAQKPPQGNSGNANRSRFEK